MGPLFPFAFFLLCLIVVIAIAALIKDNKARLIFTSVVAAVVVCIAILMVVEFYLDTAPSFVFKDAFDFDPPADVLSLQGEISDSFDLKETWLCFKAKRATVEMLVEKRRMSEVSRRRAIASNFTATQGTPDYWKPFVTESAKFYTSADEREKLIYNEQEGEVFFRSWKLQ